ncbi:hypothetical protein Tco_0507256, partial [Tanacetum coccineum]
EPPPPLSNHKQYMPGGRKELKLCEAKTIEPTVHEPPEVELKELPPQLEKAKGINYLIFLFLTL